MKTDIECIACFYKQVLSTVRKVNAPEKLAVKCFSRAAEIVKTLPMATSPAENTYPVLKAVQKLLRNDDPYADEKVKFNKVAPKLYPRLKRIVARSADPVHSAAKIAVAGNIIDLGILSGFSIEHTLRDVLKHGFRKDDIKLLKQQLSKAKTLLYLLDNTGEIVFDKVFLEELRKRYPQLMITAVANSGPILNDATMKDVRFVGLDEVVPVMPSGSDSIGKIPSWGSKDYQKMFREADVVIGKGHGNYETLNSLTKNIFFILKAKCPVVAQSLGIEHGEVVLLHNPKNHTNRG